MCLGMVEINGTKVPCNECWQCRYDRVEDFVGRCIAEQRTSRATLALTLTYADGAVGSSVLVYEDVQKLFKRLRKAGFPVRYLVVGELGSRKGRAHWHCVLFFKDKVPALVVGERQSWSFWPYGIVFPQVPDYGGFRYLLKYVLKHEVPEQHATRIRMSKKPPLGAQFFYDMADEMALSGLPFRTPSYAFAEVKAFSKPQAREVPRQFWLRGRMLELMLARYVASWEKAWGDSNRLPVTELVEAKHFDAIVAKGNRADLDFEALDARERRATRIQLHAARVAERERRQAEASPQLGFILLPERLGIGVLLRNGQLLIHPLDEVSESWRVDAARSDGGESQLREVGFKQDLARSVSGWAQRLLQAV